MNWSKYPFLRLLLPLVFGMLLYGACDVPPIPDPWLLGMAVLWLGILFLWHRRSKSYRHRRLFGFLVLLSFLFLGFFRACLQEVSTKEGYFGRFPTTKAVVARVFEPPIEKEKVLKMTLEVLGLHNGDSVIQASGKIMAYFEKSEAATYLDYGDVLAFFVPIEEVPPSLNPAEFDYKKFLERKGITGQVYLKSDSWVSLGMHEGNRLLTFAYRLRDRLLGTLRNGGITEEEFGVGAAVLLGYDDSLPPQVRQQYVAAGAMHVLCVSGMHVGIIYLLSSYLLNLLISKKRLTWLRQWILLLLIWFYALLTGLSPSILRATLMLSFVIFGELIHQKGFPVNSIAASAFVLLMLDPNALYAMGFQLSYVAVLGIVLLQKPIYNLLYVKNKLLDKLWEIMAVSFAAQFATMPFTVYYFQQFTPYFWLSNLFMAPLSFLVILLGMLFLAFSWMPWVGAFMGKLVWMSLHVMNGLVAWVERLPYSMVKGLYINKVSFVLWLLMLVLFLLFVTIKRKRMLLELLTVGAMFCLSILWHSIRCSGQETLLVYSLRNHTAISMVEGFHSVLLCDADLLSDPSSIDYHMKGAWARAQLPMNPVCFTLEEDFRHPLLAKRQQWLSFHGEILAFWDGIPPKEYGHDPMPVDYLLVRGRHRPDLKRAMDHYQVGLLLIDGSVPFSLAMEWERQASRDGVPFHELREGCFIKNYAPGALF